MIAELVRQAREGDAEAYAELVRRFQDAVFATAYQTVLEFEAARDLAQETFVRAYERLGSLRDAASFPGWVVRICRNLAVSWLRQPEREWVALDGAEVPAADLAERVATRDLVSRALSTLPEDNRLALSLFLVNGYSYQEVAELTEAPVTTVKGRIERARRKLAAEVLAMTEDTLKGSAPDEQFTLETVRRSLAKARQAREEHELVAARTLAEEALEALSKVEADEEQRREMKLDALSTIRVATRFPDPERWAKAVRQSIRVHEEAGDEEALSQHLYTLALQDRQLTRTEREALVDRCLALFEQTGQAEMLGEGLFFRGWHLIAEGKSDDGFGYLDSAREALAGEPYGSWHGCLDASAELQRLTQGELDTEKRVRWGASCIVARLEGDRLVHCGTPGFVGGSGERDEISKWYRAFELLERIGWLPHTAPGPGHQEEKNTFSYTGNPTHTRIWIESDEAAVSTPAGEFEGCLLMRATTTASPLDAEADERKRDLNKIWCGEKYCWLARGVGPVAYRSEHADSVVDHAVLSHFECPEEREEWVPLVVGTRWEHVPAEPAEDVEARVVTQLTHVDEEQRCYLAHTAMVTRRE